MLLLLLMMMNGDNRNYKTNISYLHHVVAIVVGAAGVVGPVLNDVRPHRVCVKRRRRPTQQDLRRRHRDHGQLTGWTGKPIRHCNNIYYIIYSIYATS